MSDTVHRFRYDFLPFWRLQTTICTAGVFATWLALSRLLERPLTRPDAFTSLGVSAACALVLAIVIAAVRFQVSPAGLRTFDTLGRWRVVPWHAVARAEPARYYFLPHLRLTVDGHARHFWVPLFLHDMAGYRQAVIATAGGAHPLARALPVPASVAER